MGRYLIRSNPRCGLQITRDPINIAGFSGFRFRGQRMANSAQAKKRARQAVEHNARNSALRTRLRSAIKKVRKAIAAGDKTVAKTVFNESMSIIDSVADKRIVHKNKSSRHKSRLSAAIKAMS
jgi:small subunit ribosomal protein S20